MAINLDKPNRWKPDIARSVDFFNEWFLAYAPATYQSNRQAAVQQVEKAMRVTEFLTRLTPEVLRADPNIIPILRMTTAPPLARDRLIGLSGVNQGLVLGMEKRGKLPKAETTDQDLAKLANILSRLVDQELFPWLATGVAPTEQQSHRAATIVADRLCGSISDPMIRNAQEQRQLATLRSWLEQHGYRLVHPASGRTIKDFEPGTFAFRFNVPVSQELNTRAIGLPIDAVVMPQRAAPKTLPLLIEAKSAGDYTNTNKRRKEEAQKVNQLRHSYGNHVMFLLLLCGYFNSGYLGYEAAEGIDWVWEHRLDDLLEAGL